MRPCLIVSPETSDNDPQPFSHLGSCEGGTRLQTTAVEFIHADMPTHCHQSMSVSTTRRDSTGCQLVLLNVNFCADSSRYAHLSLLYYRKQTGCNCHRLTVKKKKSPALDHFGSDQHPNIPFIQILNKCIPNWYPKPCHLVKKVVMFICWAEYLHH